MQINFEDGRFKEVVCWVPKYAHSVIICGQTGCGKTESVLDFLETEYAGVFENIVILCPTIEWNKAYKNKIRLVTCGDQEKPNIFYSKSDKKYNYNKSDNARRKGDTSRIAAFVLSKICWQDNTLHNWLLLCNKRTNKEKRYVFRTDVFRETCRAECLCHFTEIHFCFKRSSRADKMGLNVLYER